MCRPVSFPTPLQANHTAFLRDPVTPPQLVLPLHKGLAPQKPRKTAPSHGELLTAPGVLAATSPAHSPSKPGPPLARGFNTGSCWVTVPGWDSQTLAKGWHTAPGSSLSRGSTCLGRGDSPQPSCSGHRDRNQEALLPGQSPSQQHTTAMAGTRPAQTSAHRARGPSATHTYTHGEQGTRPQELLKFPRL